MEFIFSRRSQLYVYQKKGLQPKFKQLECFEGDKYAYMFAETQAYNQPMNNWNTSKVTNMTFMFHFNPAFNQPLDQWNTSNVINMGHMFHGCSAFNQTINVWNTSKVTDMNTMFTEAQVLTKVYIHGTSRFLLQEIICFIIQASIVKLQQYSLRLGS
jgi:surface protein